MPMNGYEAVRTIKPVKNPIPQNGYLTQIKSNPYFFDRRSPFYQHLQDLRNQVRSSAREWQFTEYVHKHGMSEMYERPIYLEEETDVYMVYDDDDSSSKQDDSDDEWVTSKFRKGGKK